MGYWNEIDKKETEEIIRNDSYFTRQRDALDEAGGRFSKVNPTTVTGAKPPEYPQIPTGPWGGSNPVPPNPATDCIDYDPNFVEPVQPTPPDPDSVVPAVDRHVGSAGGAQSQSPGAPPATHSRKPAWRRF
jgi:hypothetical protein